MSLSYMYAHVNNTTARSEKTAEKRCRNSGRAENLSSDVHLDVLNEFWGKYFFRNFLKNLIRISTFRALLVY